MTFTKKTQLSFTALAMLAFAAMPNIASAVAGDAAAVSTNIMNSSPLYSDSTQSYHACNVMNTTTAALKVKIDVISSTGTTLATSGAAPVTLAAGEFTEISTSLNYTGFARCRISTANPENIRANLTVFHWTGSYYDSLAISEVR